jgi:hypothetical protein
MPFRQGNLHVCYRYSLVSGSEKENQNIPTSTLSVPSLFAIPVLLRCNQVYEFWLDQWFPNIIELAFTLNQRSKNSKNWAKVPTINCGCLTWLFHENHQFFETERINFYVLVGVLFSQLFRVGQSAIVASFQGCWLRYCWHSFIVIFLITAFHSLSSIDIERDIDSRTYYK